MSSARRRDSLTIAREVRGTPEQVFRALTDPEELMKWWGPKGAMTRAQVNLRPGGEYRFEYRGAAGETLWVKGQYQVVEPPRRIVTTWFNSKLPDLRNGVEFLLEGVPAGTRVTVVHSGLAGRLEAFQDYEKGWPEVLDYLAEGFEQPKKNGRG
jgi:uncharacterized protein YndB with AHSA1/START domain